MNLKKSALTTLALIVTAIAAIGAQVRDTTVRPTGTASISGTVVSDDATPRPLRRVTVMLATGDIRMPETAVTDDNGRFVFAGLAAGNYSLVATRAGYVQSFYGGKKPGRGPGVPIAVADGQRITDITLKELHGSVITGIVRDQSGQPISDLPVQITEVQMVNGARRLNTVGALAGVTDDRGVYRVFGMPPGAYMVMARTNKFGFMSGESRQVTSDDVRWAQQATSANAAVTPGMPPPPLPPAPEPGQTVTYTSIYYPGTPDPAGASLVTVGPNEERGGVDFSVMLVPTARVSGTVVDADGQIPQSAQVSLVPAQSDATDMVGVIMGQLGLGGGVVQDGKFTLTGVTPGRYKVKARGTARQPGGGPPSGGGPGDLMQMMLMGGRAGGIPGMGGGAGNLWAVDDIVVDGREIANLSLRLQPGMNVSGKIVFEATTLKAPSNFAATRLTLSAAPAAGAPGDAMSSMLTSMMGGTAATISEDGSFVAKGVVPDRYRAMLVGPGMLGAIANLAAAAGQSAALPPDSWTLKSMMLNGRDVSDTAFEVRPGEDVSGLVITYTDRPTELSGRVTDRAGRPAPGFPIVVFSTDHAQWVTGSRRVRQARPASDGKYTITGLPAGEYFLCAVTDLDPNDLSDPTFLEQLAASGALKVTLTDGEKKTQDLRLAGG